MLMKMFLQARTALSTFGEGSSQHHRLDIGASISRSHV
jgi:hypothetical protein